MRGAAGLAILLTTLGASHARAGPAPSSAVGERLAAAAFSAPSAETGGISQMLDQRLGPAAAGPRDWSSGETKLSDGPRAVDTLHVTTAAPPSASGRPLRLAGFLPEEQAYEEVRVVRDWPRAVSFSTGPLGLDVSPHAGVGMSSYGGLAEAGAVVQLSQRRDEAAVERLKALGVRDGASFGQRGRWYLFAAASGRAVGLNMLRSDSGWNRAGWTTDATSTLVGDTQVGVGWRKGAMQTSFGYIHREIKGLHTFYGVDSKADSVVAFTFSVRPRR